jgi:hypothetical protein
MKFSSKQFLGVLFIAASVLTLPQAIRQVLPVPVVMDFPCEADQDIRQEGMDASTRIAYCLSLWPFNMGGGGIYALGISNEEEVSVTGLHFRRDGETLYVNNRVVHTGGLYETVRWTATRNPWVILTNHFEVRNEGLVSFDSIAPPDVLFISGDVHQGWVFSPLGFLLLLAGMVLLLREFKTPERPVS